MRLLTVLLTLILVISCKQNNTQRKELKPDGFTDPGNSIEVDDSTQLRYYKCDYAKNRYDTILSSGDGHQITEVWGIDKKDIASLPLFKMETLDTNVIIQNAARYIKTIFPDIDFLSTRYSLERINEKDNSNPRNWFIEVSFLYDKRGYYQEVPLLLDGRIILSSNE
jgi:hypothetical protein